MTRKLHGLGPGELASFVRDEELDEPAILEVLRNPHCTVEIALLVANSARWTGSHTVRELLAGFRGFPFARSMDLLPTLPWVSLLQLAQAPSTPPVVRRQAERKLLERLAKMTLGEKVALARRAHRPLFASLIGTSDPQVLTALLDNPRLVENDVFLILNTAKIPPEFFLTLGRHQRWGQSYGVRLGLAECAHTPFPLALSALVMLNPGDLRRITQRHDLPEQIRVAAAILHAKKKSHCEK